jgi:hypothetical protein
MFSSTHIIALQRKDHDRMETLLRRYERGPAEVRPRVYRQVVELVTTHAFAEESVLFPAARRYLALGEGLTGDIEDKHQRINELLARMQGSGPGEPGFEAQAAEAFGLLRADAREEEDQLLVALGAKLDDGQMRALGAAWLAVRRTAPNRPHPRVSRRPPWNILAALVLSITDRLRRLRWRARAST